MPAAKYYYCKGLTLTLKEWSVLLGVPVARLKGRLYAGMEYDRVFSSGKRDRGEILGVCVVDGCSNAGYRRKGEAVISPYCREHQNLSVE